MKKFLIGCALALLICANVFADVELGVALEPSLSMKGKGTVNGNDVTVVGKGNFGLTGRVTPFFGTVPIANKFTLDIGANVQVGMYSWNKIKISSGNFTVEGKPNDTDIFGYTEPVDSSCFLFAVGPAGRFNINEKNSVYATLGFKGLLGLRENEFNGYFNFDMGYRFWFVNTTGFHLGAMAGLNFAVGGLTLQEKRPGLTTIFDKPITHSLSSSMVNIYLGITFAFGWRGYEKKANIWNMDSLPTYPQDNAYVFDADTLNDDFKDKIIFRGTFDLQKTAFELYAYNMSASKWILVGRTTPDVRDSSLVIRNNEDMTYYRYFAIVPTDKDAEAMQYSFNVEWHDLYVSVY